MNPYLRFLLPSQTMDWVAFLILSGMFISGWFMYVSEKRKGVPIPDNQWLFGHEIEDALHSRPQGYILLLPSLMLIVGLFFTFWGLGMAIQQAAEAIQSSQKDGPSMDLVHELRGVLGMIGMKFKASVWGIIGHLLAQTMASGVRHDRREAFRRYLERRTEGFIPATHEHLGHQGHPLNTIAPAMQQFQNTAAKMESGASSIQYSAGNLATAANNMNKAINKVATDFGSAISSFESSSQTQLGNLSTAVMGIPNSLAGSLSDFQSAIQGTLSGISIALTNSADELKKAQSEGLQSINTVTTAITKELQSGLEAMNDTNREVKNAVETVIKYGNKTAAILTPLNSTLQSLSDQSKEDRDRSYALIETFAKSLEEFKISLDAVLEVRSLQQKTSTPNEPEFNAGTHE